MTNMISEGFETVAPSEADSLLARIESPACSSQVRQAVKCQHSTLS